MPSVITQTEFRVDTIKDDSFCLRKVFLDVEAEQVITVHKLQLDVRFVILCLNPPHIGRI